MDLMANTTAVPSFPAAWTDSLTTDSDDGPVDRHYSTYAIFQAGQLVRDVFPPFTILLGTFGNIMTIIITSRRMRSTGSTIDIYFTALAVVDLIMLWTGVFWSWLYYLFKFVIGTTHNVMCKITTWISTGWSTIGCWYLVCMTVQRAISVVWPHRVNVLCTRRTVLLLLTAITVFFAIVYSHYLIGYEIIPSRTSNRKYWCGVRPDNDSYILFTGNIFIYVELLIYCLLPFVFLAGSNTILVYNLRQSVTLAGQQLGKGDSQQVRNREKAARSVTLTVIVVSLTFLLLTLPLSLNYIFIYLDLAVWTISGEDRAKASFSMAVCSALNSLHHCSNFFLYCLTGQTFREDFCKIMGCLKHRQRHDAPPAIGSNEE